MTGVTTRAALTVSALCLASAACGGAKEPVEATPTAVQPPEGKLPEGVRPTSYRLSITIIPERDALAPTIRTLHGALIRPGRVQLAEVA